MSEGRLLQGGHTLAGDQPGRGWHKQKCLSSCAAGELTGGDLCQVLPCVTCVLAVPPPLLHRQESRLGGSGQSTRGGRLLRTWLPTRSPPLPMPVTLSAFPSFSEPQLGHL